MCSFYCNANGASSRVRQEQEHGTGISQRLQHEINMTMEIFDINGKRVMIEKGMQNNAALRTGKSTGGLCLIKITKGTVLFY